MRSQDSPQIQKQGIGLGARPGLQEEANQGEARPLGHYRKIR